MTWTRTVAASLVIALPLAATAIAPSAYAAEITVYGAPEQLCSDLTGSTDSIMLSDISDSSKQLQCAYTDDFGMDNIGALAVATWSFEAPAGYSADYTDTSSAGADNVEIGGVFAGGSSVGTSWVVTAINGNLNSQKWGACILWSTADFSKNGAEIDSSQYRKSCKDADMQAFRMFPVSMEVSGSTPALSGEGSKFTFIVDGSAYGGDFPAEGMVAMYLQTGATPNPSVDRLLGGAPLVMGASVVSVNWPAAGTYNVYGVYAGSDTSSPQIPGRGWTPAITDSMSITVIASASNPCPPTADMCIAKSEGHVTQSTRMAGMQGDPEISQESVRRSTWSAGLTALEELKSERNTFRGPAGTSVVEERTSTGGELSVRCPSGGVPTQFNLLSSSQGVVESDIELRDFGFDGASVQAPRGAKTGLQVICRELDAPVQRDGALTYGSARADRIVTPDGSDQHVFAGLGNDNLRLTAKGSRGWGGLGSDNIIASAAGVVASGGFGNDTVRSTTGARTLLIGGPGEDVLIGGPGETLINARDGQGGDTVACKSPQNRVLADKGDTVIGPCQVL